MVLAQNEVKFAPSDDVLLEQVSSDSSIIPETLIPTFESYLKQYEAIRSRRDKGRILIHATNQLMQLVAIWVKLYEQQNDPRYFNASLKGMDKLVEKNSEGDRIFKLLLKKIQSALHELSSREFPTLKREIPCYEIGSGELENLIVSKSIDVSIVILSGQNASMTNGLVRAMMEVGVKPLAILVDMSDLLSHTCENFYRYDLGDNFYNRYGNHIGPWYQPSGREPTMTAVDTAREYGLTWQVVDHINSIESEKLIKQYAPELCVLSSVGVIRQNILSLPKIGTLNAHSGILPFYRGIDVVGWSMLERNPIGCSVHFIDEGVDTGDILFTHMLSYEECKKGVKVSLKKAKTQLLLWALDRISKGKYERHRQDKSMGRLFFRMHPIIKYILNKRYMELGPRAFTGNINIR